MEVRTGQKQQAMEVTKLIATMQKGCSLSMLPKLSTTVAVKLSYSEFPLETQGKTYT